MKRVLYGLLLLAAACASGQKRVASGEELLAAGRAGEALEAFVEAQRDPKLKGIDLTRAQVGEARAFLALGELQNAKNRLRRLLDTVSAKHYHLAEIALREGDRVGAAACFQRASELTHGGDTAARWATVVAAEATDPADLGRAVEILARGGETTRAKALAEALAVWRGLLTGEAPAALLPRLEAVQGTFPDHASLRVLRARLLDRLGRSAEADQAWDLSKAEPVPSAAYQAQVVALRTRLAAEAGDAAGLAKALDQGDPAVAARLRSELAERRRENGDTWGALQLLRETIQRGGEPAALAAAQAAELEALLGLAEESAANLALARRAAAPSPALSARLALFAAAEGDLRGAESLARGPRDRRTAEVVGAAARLRAALAALVEGREGEAARLARAVRLTCPADPAALAIEAAATPRTATERAALLRGAAGETQGALDAAAIALLLDAGALGEALTRQGREATPRAAFKELVAAGLLAALRARQVEAARRFPADQGELCLPSAALAPAFKGTALSRGIPALVRGERAVGALGGPSGFRLPIAELARQERGWAATLPEGTPLTLADDAALEALLGASLDRLEWWPVVPERPAAGALELQAAARALRAPPWPAAPVLEVE